MHIGFTMLGTLMVVNIAYQVTQAWGTYLKGYLMYFGFKMLGTLMVVNIAHQGIQAWWNLPKVISNAYWVYNVGHVDGC